MAVISPSTFDALRSYVAVRLQQGVPLVDSDWNELDDARRFELRAFLKWFVGDGVPADNDGFRIEGNGLANDFVIRAGTGGPADGLHNVGRCLVDGWDLMIPSNLAFSSQPLHADQPGSAALAAAWGVAQVQPLTTPAADGTVVAYLDAWERLVTPSEDPSLVHAGLGTESCARLKREWVVRVRSGPGAPVPADGPPDYQAGHSYYALATISRRSGDPNINPGDVTDRRERRLLCLPETLVTDLLGLQVEEYRRGLGRPAISLREAINALMRGELPSTAPAPIAPAAGIDLVGQAFLFDDTNGVVAAWESNRLAGVNQVFATRLDRADIGAGFATPPHQVTGGSPHRAPHAALLPNGELLVVYESGAIADPNILLKRAGLAGLGAAAEQTVADTAGEPERSPFVAVSGTTAVIFLHRGTPVNRWEFRRWRTTDSTWIDGAPLPLSTAPASSPDFHAARDGAGNLWAAFRRDGGNVQALRLAPATGTRDHETSIDSGAGVDQEPFVLPTSQGDVWVFWRSHSSSPSPPTGLHSRRFSGGAWGAVDLVSHTLPGDRQPAAVEDTSGVIWLFWTRGASPSSDIYFMGRNPATGGWGEPRQMTISTADDTAPFTLIAPNNAIWVFWSSDRAGDVDLYYKRLVTAI